MTLLGAVLDVLFFIGCWVCVGWGVVDYAAQALKWLRQPKKQPTTEAG